MVASPSLPGRRRATTTLLLVAMLAATGLVTGDPAAAQSGNYGDHHYRVVDQHRTWSDAVTYCEQDGGYLATISSAGENQFVSDLLPGIQAASAWLGGTDQEVEGTWAWVTGEPFEYSNWYGADPNDAGGMGEDTMAMSIAIESRGQWIDWQYEQDGSESELPFTCEYEPESGWTADACHPDEAVRAWFTDVAGNVHAAAIDCLAWWGITRGTAEHRYDPGGDVTRAQMASFLIRVAEVAKVALPPDPPDRFDDDEGTPHELAINQLAELGVVTGRSDTTYAPQAPVTRAAMAAFLVRTYELVTGEALSSPRDHFDDDEESSHEDAINAVAEAGFTTGVTATAYGPARSVTRAQMASFMTRLLDPLVTWGFASLPA